MKNMEQILARMKEDILLRGLSKNTLLSYTLNARIFLEYCNRSAVLPSKDLPKWKDDTDLMLFLNSLCKN